MESIEKLILYIVSLVFFAGSIFLTQQFIGIAEQREDYVIEDQAKKSAVELNVSASGGSQVLTASEVHTNILSHPKNLKVMLNGNEISYSTRQLAYTKDSVIHVPFGSYTAYYVYDTEGYITSVDYRKI